MAKLLMIIGDNFEDVEGIATMDILKRGGHLVYLASVMNRLEVKTKCGYILKVDSLIQDINLDEFDGVIIPGGPGSFTILDKLEVVDSTIKYFADRNKLMSAICAAPFLIGRLGYLKDKNYTVHPGFEDQIVGGRYLRYDGVVVDGNFITAKSMYYSIQFGLAIHEYFNGKESRNALERSCMGE